MYPDIISLLCYGGDRVVLSCHHVKPDVVCFLVYELVKIIHIRFTRTRYWQLQTLNLCSSLNMADQVSQTYKTRHKITVLYILTSVLTPQTGGHLQYTTCANRYVRQLLHPVITHSDTHATLTCCFVTSGVCVCLLATVQRSNGSNDTHVYISRNCSVIDWLVGLQRSPVHDSSDAILSFT
jgi:hypothetical protein